MATIISTNNDLSSINWVNGMSDPGEMIACGYMPEIRRHAGEQDAAYAARIRPIIDALPADQKAKIMKAGVEAAKKRAGLDISNGKVSVMVAGEPAWHGLGVNVEQAVSTEEAIVLAGLQWIVEQWPLTAWNPADFREIDVPARKANVRSDTKAVLGVVGDGYTPLQNHEAFAFMDQIVGEGGAKWETAGSLNGGKRVWMLARLPKTIEVVPGDEINPYGLICNGHDGTLAVHILPTTVRVVCNNTLNLSLNSGKGKRRKGGNELTIRHSQSLKGKVEEAKMALGIVAKRAEQFGEEARLLTTVAMNDQSAKRYFEQFYPTKVKPEPPPFATEGLLDAILETHGQTDEVVADLLAGHYAETERIAKRNQKMLDQLLENFEDPSNSIPGMRGTAWAAYNSLSEMADHQMNHRTADTRLQSAWFGRGNEIKQQAFDAAMELVAK